MRALKRPVVGATREADKRAARSMGCSGSKTDPIARGAAAIPDAAPTPVVASTAKTIDTTATSNKAAPVTADGASDGQSDKTSAKKVGDDLLVSKALFEEPSKGIDLFTIEKTAGVTAEDVNTYLAGLIGQDAVTNLRSAMWAERVKGLEEVKSQLLASRGEDVTKQISSFKVSVTVLSRVLQVLPHPSRPNINPPNAARLAQSAACLSEITAPPVSQEKIVPVYLPALEVLVALFDDEHLTALPAEMPCAAVAVLCDLIVLRCGSSNSRARDDSIEAVLHCAHSKALGPGVVARHVLKPLSNTSAKLQTAAVGRLELLHRLVAKYGFSATGYRRRDSDPMPRHLDLQSCIPPDSCARRVG